MKVCHLTSVHMPQDSRIFHKECRSLVNAGYDVTLVVKSKHDEVLNGIKIVKIREENSRIKRMFYTTWLVYQKAIIVNADIYHFHDPELILIGILLRFRGKKVIYDIHEDLPRQILNKPWITSWLRYPFSWLASLAEWISSRIFFTSIVAATPKIAARFPREKTITVQNFPILQELVFDNQTSYSERPDHIVYIGGISKIRGAVENISAFEYVKHKDCHLILAGEFENRQLEEECRKLNGWLKVDYKGWLNRDQIKSMLDNARIGLVLLHPTINYIDSYPIKLFEYMSAGIPVIASNFPLWRKIIENAECGLLVDPFMPEDIAAAIEYLLENPEKAQYMGENGRKAVINQYNWSNEEKKLVSLYRTINGCLSKI